GLGTTGGGSSAAPAGHGRRVRQAAERCSAVRCADTWLTVRIPPWDSLFRGGFAPSGSPLGCLALGRGWLVCAGIRAARAAWALGARASRPLFEPDLAHSARLHSAKPHLVWITKALPFDIIAIKANY